MMAPAELGRLLTEVAPKAGESALVIGSATGYSSAILKDVGLDVVALESDEGLARRAKDAGVDTVQGDLAKGWAKGAPYDIILLDGAVEEVPGTLAKQLASEGRLAGAIVDRGVTRLIVGTCVNGVIGWRSIADADVGVLPGFERPRAFTF